MVERIPQHRHCMNCNRATPSDKEFCNEACDSEYTTQMKTKKRQLQFFYVIMIAVFIFVMLFSITAY